MYIIQFPQDEYSMHHDAVFIDASSTVNLLAGVPLCSLDMVNISHFFVERCVLIFY